MYYSPLSGAKRKVEGTKFHKCRARSIHQSCVQLLNFDGCFNVKYIHDCHTNVYEIWYIFVQEQIVGLLQFKFKSYWRWVPLNLILFHVFAVKTVNYCSIPRERTYNIARMLCGIDYLREAILWKFMKYYGLISQLDFISLIFSERYIYSEIR